MRKMTRQQIVELNPFSGPDLADHIFGKCGFLVFDEELYIRSIEEPDTALIILALGEPDGCGVLVFERMVAEGFSEGVDEEIETIALIHEDREYAYQFATDKLAALFSWEFDLPIHILSDGNPALFFGFVDQHEADAVGQMLEINQAAIEQLMSDITHHVPGLPYSYAYGSITNVETGEVRLGISLVWYDASMPQNRPSFKQALADLFGSGDEDLDAPPGGLVH